MKCKILQLLAQVTHGSYSESSKVRESEGPRDKHVHHKL